MKLSLMPLSSPPSSAFLSTRFQFSTCLLDFHFFSVSPYPSMAATFLKAPNSHSSHSCNAGSSPFFERCVPESLAMASLYPFRSIEVGFS